MKYGNCWFYAIPRFMLKGGYLIIRWSPRNRFVPHVSYSTNLETMEEFVPVRPRTGLLGVLSSVFFRGFVRTGKIEK